MLLPKRHSIEKLLGGKELCLFMRICNKDHQALSTDFLDPVYLADVLHEVARTNSKRGQAWKADQNTKNTRMLRNHQPREQLPVPGIMKL